MAVGERDGEVADRGLGDRGGVGDGAAGFGQRRRGAKADGGAVVVDNRGRDVAATAGTGQYEAFEVAAAGASQGEVKLSLPSARASSMVAMLKLALLDPAGMVTVVLPLKSVPLRAVPLWPG